MSLLRHFQRHPQPQMDILCSFCTIYKYVQQDKATWSATKGHGLDIAAKKDFDYGPNPARAVHPMPKSVDTYAIESYQNEQYELYLFWVLMFTHGSIRSFGQGDQRSTGERGR